MNTAEWQYFPSADASAVQQWMSGWKQAHPEGGVLALVAEHDKAWVPELQASALQAGMPLVGAVFPELVVQARFSKQGVLLCGLGQMPAYQLLGQLSDERHRELAVAALRDITQGESDEATLMLIFDGMFAQVASLLDDLFYAVGGAFAYAGVNAGSETFQPMPCLFDRERLIGDGVLALLLPEHPGADLEHGYVVPDETLTASAATGNRVVQIDWQPAFQKYAELIERHYGQKVDRENFYTMGVHFPFALMRADGQVLIRIPVAVDDEGALYCVGEVPDGALLSVAQAVAPGSRETVDVLVRKFSSHQAETGLFFYCAGRRMHLGEEAGNEELGQLARQLGSLPVMGALSLGEIGNSAAGGYPLFHNAALVAMPLATRS